MYFFTLDVCSKKKLILHIILSVAQKLAAGLELEQSNSQQNIISGSCLPPKAISIIIVLLPGFT